MTAGRFGSPDAGARPRGGGSVDGRLPLADVQGGAHDPKELWPTTSGAGGELLHAAGFFPLALTPIGLLAVLARCGWLLADTRGDRAGRARPPGPTACVVAVAGLTVAVLVLMFSPLGSALSVWTLD